MLEKLFKILCAIFFIAFITSVGVFILWACFTRPDAVLIPVLGILGFILIISIPAIIDTGYNEVMSWFKPSDES